jgi:peptidoglycan hydrolase CwlO-like protein
MEDELFALAQPVLDELKRQRDEAKSEVTRLNAEVERLNNERPGLQDQIDQAHAALAAAQGEVTTANERIRELEDVIAARPQSDPVEVLRVLSERLRPRFEAYLK